MALGLLVVRFLRKVFGLKFAVQRRMLTQHRLVPSRNPKQTLVFFALADTTESDIQSFDAFLGWALGTMGCEGIVSGQVGPLRRLRRISTRGGRQPPIYSIHLHSFPGEHGYDSGIAYGVQGMQGMERMIWITNGW